MAEYIEIDKLIDICNSTEPFTVSVSGVVRTIKNQPVLVWNNYEDCVFELECDTHLMHCNSFMTPETYLKLTLEKRNEKS